MLVEVVDRQINVGSTLSNTDEAFAATLGSTRSLALCNTVAIRAVSGILAAAEITKPQPKGGVDAWFETCLDRQEITGPIAGSE